MSFDKNKAMRNAERFLSQGKIRAAINEYQRIVENDPKDFSTLNILGDLHAKNRDNREAVGCFTQVADYYNMQGFAHKAIAVYNKISRIEPNSMEVSAKLAELYQSKGSIAEARRHYTTLAENYQRRGQKIEALAIWKQIAELDPNNTEIYLKIAETCWQEEQFDEAARAFTEAGLRFLKYEKFESALTAFSRALEIKKNDLRAVKGSVKAQMSLGYSDEAAKILEGVLRHQPHNRDILHLLAECYLDMENAPEAESAIIRLVEQEPASYPKFLDSVKIYLKTGNLDAAARVLLISSQQLLGGGQAEEFLQWTNEILTRNPEHLQALRLLAQYYVFQRDEIAIKQSLERLAEAARLNEAVEDEHYALSQLVLSAPQEISYSQRLQELNRLHGFETESPIEEPTLNDVPEFQNLNASDEHETNNQNGYASEFDFADVKSVYDFQPENSMPGVKEFEFYNPPAENEFVIENFESNSFETNSFETNSFEFSAPPPAENSALTNGDEFKLQKELESIEFYISQGYADLAAKTLDELEESFGWQKEIAELRKQLSVSLESPPSEDFTHQPIVAEEKSLVADYAPKEIQVENPVAKNFESLDDLREEIGFEDSVTAKIDDDYETHYHLGTAYKEMGLLENSIREFQEAINLVKVDDKARRFFQCANLLGHCFMEKRMPNLAVTWFERALQVPDLSDEEKHAVYYELGNAFESGDKDKEALDYFEKLYAENVGYRDISERLHKLHANVPTT